MKADAQGNRDARFERFQDLMRFRVREILLVSSKYDSFILSEDGSLYESLLNEYIGLGLTHMPSITRVSSGTDALRLAREPGKFDLVITSLRVEDMHATRLVVSMREVGIETPVVLLTYDNREASELIQNDAASEFDRVFIWQGDFRVVLAIVKYIEDRANVDADTRLIGVQTVILVEDDVRFYSSYLPLVYTAVLGHTAELITEGVNPAQRLVRLRARPKIILCVTYEEAWQYFEKYHDTILGVISDVEFPRGGELDGDAGFELARAVIRSHADIPVLLQSQGPENRLRAEGIGASYLQKDSPTLLHELRNFMVGNFGFGDFVFRLRDGTVVLKAPDVRTLEEHLYNVPDESIAFHGERNDFSTWLKSRTEFRLAHRLRPVKVSDYPSISALREHLIATLRIHRRDQQRGRIVDFDPDTFDANSSFARLGGGSLGGKARGLAFANAMIDASGMEHDVDGVRILVPPSIVVGTDVFDRFMEHNGLWSPALESDDDDELQRKFRDAEFPPDAEAALGSFVGLARFPLSVRSSSLLEDSQFMPFAGVYETFMIPNSHADPSVRLGRLLVAIKRVYASTFSRAAKRYVRSTPYRLEEEKMAVIVQKLVGSQRAELFYPDFSGVARSHNFYPIQPMESGDGIVSVALGLGKHVVDGGESVRFCPRYPRHLVQFSRIDDILQFSQKAFYALALPGADDIDVETMPLVTATLEVAVADGTLAAVGSTYSPENDAVYDGIGRDGIPVVTFAPILKNDVFPLATIVDRLLDSGKRGMSAPVEIEFAVDLHAPGGGAEFHLLQMRPMVIDQELERLQMIEYEDAELLCRTDAALGNGIVGDVKDVVVVDINGFDRCETMVIAREVARFNMEMLEAGKPYVLIGVGRWGSADPWLGVPVRWEDINGARVIVESGMRDISVTPSQGTHFFQNINASRIGYLTVTGEGSRNFVDWAWLAAQPAVCEGRYTRHIAFDTALTVMMDGHEGRAAIIKPRITQ